MRIYLIFAFSSNWPIAIVVGCNLVPKYLLLLAIPCNWILWNMQNTTTHPPLLVARKKILLPSAERLNHCYHTHWIFQYGANFKALQNFQKCQWREQTCRGREVGRGYNGPIELQTNSLEGPTLELPLLSGYNRPIKVALNHWTCTKEANL
jgi:hypothetical protein